MVDHRLGELMVGYGTPTGPCRSMSRYPVQDGLTGQGASGKHERNLNRLRQDGVRILERTAEREGWGAAWGSSWRTFGAPRPVLNPGLTQRDMKRENPHAAAPALCASWSASARAQSRPEAARHEARGSTGVHLGPRPPAAQH